MLEQYERVIFTTGVFDLFHHGHVKFLREASKLGDFLLVGLHSDRTVLKYKQHLPVMNLQERVDVVQSCRYVDACVVAKMTSEMTAQTYDKWNIGLHVQGDEKPGWYDLPKQIGIFQLIPNVKIFSTR